MNILSVSDASYDVLCVSSRHGNATLFMITLKESSLRLSGPCEAWALPFEAIGQRRGSPSSAGSGGGCTMGGDCRYVHVQPLLGTLEPTDSYVSGLNPPTGQHQRSPIPSHQRDARLMRAKRHQALALLTNIGPWHPGRT